MTDEPAPTVRSRLRAAGISDESIDAHHGRGTIRMDGEAVSDLEQAAADGARIVIGAVG